MQAVTTAQWALVERPWCVIFSIFVKIVLSNPPPSPLVSYLFHFCQNCFIKPTLPSCLSLSQLWRDWLFPVRVVTFLILKRLVLFFDRWPILGCIKCMQTVLSVNSIDGIYFFEVFLFFDVAPSPSTPI